MELFKNAAEQLEKEYRCFFRLFGWRKGGVGSEVR